MKRLVAITNGDLEYVDIDVIPNQGEDLIELKSFDSTDVKTNTCPECKYSPLVNKEGFKVCKNCGSAYKVFDNKVYLVV